MLRCQQCGALISSYDAQAAAAIAGDGHKTLCPCCAVALYYERQDGARDKPAPQLPQAEQQP